MFSFVSRGRVPRHLNDTSEQRKLSKETTKHTRGLFPGREEDVYPNGKRDLLLISLHVFGCLVGSTEIDYQDHIGLMIYHRMSYPLSVTD